MTKAADLFVTAQEGCSLLEAHETLSKSKKGKLPIITKSGNLVALVSRSDMHKRFDFPNATKDKNRSLVVAASVGTRPVDKDRVHALVAAGVDAIVVDSSQG